MERPPAPDPVAWIGVPVHFQPGEFEQPQLALIDRVDDAGMVCLNVLHAGQLRYEVQVPRAPGDVPTPGHWNQMPTMEQRQGGERHGVRMQGGGSHAAVPARPAERAEADLHEQDRGDRGDDRGAGREQGRHDVAVT
jgi:hypothetical protein